MTKEVQYKDLPYFDNNVTYGDMHNATSEAVIQLQALVHELRQEVAALKAPKTTRAAGKTAASK